MRQAYQQELTTSDQLKLPGLLFEPDQKTNKVMLVLHGCGSADVFYSVDKNQAFAEALNSRGVAYFPFNNRGAHYIKTLKRINEEGEDERFNYGTAFELIKDAVIDIEGALDHLQAQGYREFYLYGHSTGANKICVYHKYRPQNRVAKYILAGGGDDTGLYYLESGSRVKFFEYLKKAKQMIETGRGEKYVPQYIASYLFSYQSYYDVCNPDGDYNTFPFNEYRDKLKLSTKPLFGEFKSLNKPTLVVYGENDEYAPGGGKEAIQILRAQVPGSGNFDFEVISQTDHGFTGAEEELARIVANWL